MLQVGRLCSIIGIVVNALLVVAAFLLVTWIALVIVIGNVLGLPVE